MADIEQFNRLFNPIFSEKGYHTAFSKAGSTNPQ